MYKEVLNNLRIKYLSILLIVFVSSMAIANINQPTVTVAPNQTNQDAEYQIASATSNHGYARLDANVDSIIIVFNANTTVPSSINPSLITVNNTQSNAVSISGQRVAILTPVNVGQNASFTVVFASSAGIKNPSSAGNHTLQAASTGEVTLVTSAQYTISASSSTVSQAAVSPNPSVEGIAAAYTISFNVGSGGLLTANESIITIDFDPLTVIPNGSLSGVSVNGTAAAATASDNTVIITSPVNVENSGFIELVFSVGTGVKNPSSDGNYTLNVSTSSETTPVTSQQYAISDASELSVTAVTPNPSVVNGQSEYELDFVTSTSGALAANQDTIFVIFKQNTFIPSNIALSDITVGSGGFSDNAAAITVLKANSTDDDSVLITTPINIGNSSDVKVTIKNSAGFYNPSIAGNYTLQLKTSKDTSAVESNPYALANTSTTISQAIVTPNNTSASAVTSYTIDFNLGSNGRLKPGESTITLTFNNNYTLSELTSNYNNTRISVAGGTYEIIDTGNIAPNNTAKTVQISIPSSVVTSNGDNISIIIDGATTDPITNPSTSANYFLGVKTSVEATNVNSAAYNIGGTPITLYSVTLSDQTVNSISQYTFDIRTSAQLRPNDNDYIKIIFPEGINLPSSIAAGYMTINGNSPSSININQSTRTLTASVGSNQNAGRFNVIITFSANIINPAVPSSSFYKVTMNTSKNQTPVTSSAYSITGDNTQVSNVSASANPSVINYDNAEYTVNFTTSSTGKIVGGAAAGSSTITVDFEDTTTYVPSSILASAVKVNTVPCQTVTVLNSGLGGAIRITLPNGLTINNSTSVSIVFGTTAGLDNHRPAGTHNIFVKTSSDALNSDITGTAGDYSLSAVQNLSITSITPNPSVQNANASYSIKFTTGSLGALSTGDTILVVFPNNTKLPASMNTNDITVNGTALTFNPVIKLDTLLLRTPVAIGNIQNVTVLINKSAGILNPTLVQSYTAKVITSAEPGPFVSPAYNITQTSTTVSAATVAVEDASTSAYSQYTVDFNVGANGRLFAGTSTISITFNNSTTVNSTPSNYDNTSIIVNSVSTVIPTTSISINSRTVTMTVPSSVSVGNDAHVSIIINSVGATKPIQNPSSEGNYTLQVRTSVETSNVTSNSYPISDQSPVSNISVIVPADTVNAASADTISFQVDAISGALSASSGTITIRFPFNTLVPSSISTTNIRIASHPSNPSSFSNANAVSINSATRSITITTPINIANGDLVKVAILFGAGLQNPSIYGDYTLDVKTSSQPIYGTSALYSLQPTNTTITGLNVNINPSQPTVIAEYTYDFYTGSRGRLISGTSKIFLLIPYNAIFTQGVPDASKVTVNSTIADAVVLLGRVGTESDTLVVTVPSSVTIGNNTHVTVVIDQSAGLQNATNTSGLTYNAYTSVEQQPGDGDDISLPVQLSSFIAEGKPGLIQLEWITESEIDNLGFDLQRRIADDEESQFITITSYENNKDLSGKGSTPEQSIYEYQDSDLEVDVKYKYRLVQVDYNGVKNFIPVIVSASALQNLPDKFELHQNYPNPFNPETNIAFSLPKATKVTIEIYNILGQKIFNLLDNAEYEAGKQTVKWNGTNQYGNSVATGIYFYRITVDKFSDVKKMNLIK